MLYATPKNWLSLEYAVSDGDRPLTDLNLAWVRNRVSWTLDGTEFCLRSEAGPPRALVLEANGHVLARAVKERFWSSTRLINIAGADYILERPSIWSSRFVLKAAGRPEPIGAMQRQGILRLVARIDLPDSLSLASQLFLTGIALLIWRDEDSSSASVASTAAVIG